MDFRTQRSPIRLPKNTITSANKQSITRTKKHNKQTKNKIAHSIRSASSRRKLSTAWETWSTSRFARSLQTYNAPTVWHAGQKVFVHCTCGTWLWPSDKVRKLNSDRYDVLSIPNYVIQQGPSHGRRHGYTERQIIYHQAHVSSRKDKKKGNRSIQDSFLRCPIYRQSQLDIGWTEDHCDDWMKSRPKTSLTSVWDPLWLYRQNFESCGNLSSRHPGFHLPHSRHISKEKTFENFVIHCYFSLHLWLAVSFSRFLLHGALVIFVRLHK